MITIYTKPDCNFCNKAKQLLSTKNIPFAEIEIGKDISKEEILEQYPFIKTVPIILDSSRLIGGYNDLVEEMKNGDLGKIFIQD